MMNTPKKCSLYGLVLALLFTLSGCGQVSSLTTGADESTDPVTTSQILSSENQEWDLNTETDTLSYTNNSGEALTLTFTKTPLSGHIRYTLPRVSQYQSSDLGLLSSLVTYTLAHRETKQWKIESLPPGAREVVLTLHLIVDGDLITQEIPLRL
jgi:uncharacterized protein YceK